MTYTPYAENIHSDKAQNEFEKYKEQMYRYIFENYGVRILKTDEAMKSKADGFWWDPKSDYIEALVESNVRSIEIINNDLTKPALCYNRDGSKSLIDTILRSEHKFNDCIRIARDLCMPFYWLCLCKKSMTYLKAQITFRDGTFTDEFSKHNALATTANVNEDRYTFKTNYFVPLTHFTIL